MSDQTYLNWPFFEDCHRKWSQQVEEFAEGLSVDHNDVDVVRDDDVDDDGDDDDGRLPSWFTVGFMVFKSPYVLVATRPGGGYERPEASMSLSRTGSANPSSVIRRRT